MCLPSACWPRSIRSKPAGARHADLAEEIRRLRELSRKHPQTSQAPQGKSESAKDAQIARFKERASKLEQQVRELQRENELLYGKLTCQ